MEYKCKCQTPVGYISLNGLPSVRDAVLNINVKGMSETEKVIFIMNDALVLDAKNALVFSELSHTKLD